MASFKKPSSEAVNKENICVTGEEEAENEQNLMKEYYGLYGKASGDPVNQIESKPLQQLSENDISKQIDDELEIDKEANDLE